VPYQEWTQLPYARDYRSSTSDGHYPPKAITDEAFWGEPQGTLTGYWTPDSGLHRRPAARGNQSHDGCYPSRGALPLRSEVTAIRRADRVTGLELGTEHSLRCPSSSTLQGLTRVRSTPSPASARTLTSRPAPCGRKSTRYGHRRVTARRCRTACSRPRPRNLFPGDPQRWAPRRWHRT